MSEHDVLIIGGGAAGRSAALVLSRARRRVLVVDAGEPRNAPAAHVQGYLSRDGLPPGELLGLGRSEVEHYGGRVVSGTVTDLRFTAAGQLMADLADGSRLSARRVLVATGLQDVLPDIAGGDQRFGRDVLHCPYCHGYEVRDRRLGVLGGGPDSLHQVQLVRQWSRDVVFFTAGTVLTADHREQLVARAIGVVDGDVTRLLVQDDRLTGVEVDGVRVVHRDAVFRSPRFVPNTGLLARLGCDQDQNGWIVHDGGRTSVAGVWVAGNASNARPGHHAAGEAPRRPSPCTPTSSRRTRATPSSTSASACPPDPAGPLSRQHQEPSRATPRPPRPRLAFRRRASTRWP